jgi:hypothetical protein
MVPKNYQVERPNCNNYIKLYLINLTDSTLSILRIDDIIGRFSAQILIDDHWIEFQNTSGSSCGTSYWRYKLKPEYVAAIEVSNDVLLAGELRHKVRFVYDHYDQKIYSNEVEVFLNHNQLARIKYPDQTK